MKKIILASVFLLLATHSFAEQEKETSLIKDGVKIFTSSVTTGSKDALAGIKEGIDDGRKSGSSVDGAIVIFDKDNLNKYTTIKPLSVESVGDNKYLITLAIKNISDSVIRLTNLSEQQSLFILDEDDFITYLDKPQADITVPNKAATKLRVEFSGVDSKPKTIRIFGYDIDLNNK